MRARTILASSMLLLTRSADAAPESPSGGTARHIADSAVEAGRVFSSGGIDGLILWARVLSTFLMFFVALAAVWLGHRSGVNKTKMSNEAFAAKDSINAQQTKMFIESMDRTAQAVMALSVSVANDLQERAATGATLAQMQGTDAELRALLQRLDRVR